MKTPVLLVLAALSLALAGCERMKEPANKPKTEADVQKRVEAPTPGSGVPRPAVAGTAAAATKETPVQGQVDAGQEAQRKDFERK